MAASRSRRRSSFTKSVSIAPSGQSGSEVRAQGEAAGVAKLVDGLKAKLGN